MTQIQYLKTIEKELQRINKVIDQKILRGEDYSKEARDHRIMLRRMRYHTKSSFWSRFFLKALSF